MLSQHNGKVRWLLLVMVVCTVQIVYPLKRRITLEIRTIDVREETGMLQTSGGVSLRACSQHYAMTCTESARQVGRGTVRRLGIGVVGDNR